MPDVAPDLEDGVMRAPAAFRVVCEGRVTRPAMAALSRRSRTAAPLGDLSGGITDRMPPHAL